jgi:hypothetical protein
MEKMNGDMRSGEVKEIGSLHEVLIFFTLPLPTASSINSNARF